MADPVDDPWVSPPDGEEAKHEEETEERSPPITELVEQLARDVSILVFCEAQLAASRNMPEVRRVARDIAGAVLAGLAFLTAFVFANVAILRGLTAVVSDWLAALVLCAVWLTLGSLLVVALMVRAGQVTGWKWWRVFRAGPEGSLQDLERARADALDAVHETLGRLAPALTVEIASASVGVAGDVAEDVAEDVVDVGGDILEASDDMVEAIADDLPAGSVVAQIWDVILMPGRFGVKVATTVLKRGDSADSSG